MRPINLREHRDSFRLFVRLQNADKADDASDVLYGFSDRCGPGRAMKVCLSEFQQRKLGSRLSICLAVRGCRPTKHNKTNFSGVADVSLNELYCAKSAHAGGREALMRRIASQARSSLLPIDAGVESESSKAYVVIAS